MTQPAYRTAVSAQGGSAVTSLSLTRPAAAVDTDYVVVVAINGDSMGSTATPTGYTALLAPSANNASGARWAVYGKTIGADTSVVISWPSAAASGNNSAVLWLFFSGCNGVGVIGSNSGSSTNASGGVVTMTGITTTGPDRLVLNLAVIKGTSGGYASTVSFTSGLTQIAAQMASGNYYPSIAAATKGQAAAGVTSDTTATFNFAAANNYAGLQLALTPSVVALTGRINGSTAATVSATAGQAVTFVASADGGNGSTITYGWDFGDGTTQAAGSTTNVSHTYAAAGTYTVTMTPYQV